MKSLALAAGSAVLPTARAAPSRTRVVAVNVARERVQRTLVGLRPYRPSGHVVRAEKLGNKLLVHNYGHGGAGVTLSWGTAMLAADLVQKRPQSVAVLGAGAVGLATARVLQDRGNKVTIYARDRSPHTTSDIAGARWYPFDVFDKKTVSPQFLSSLWSASRVSYGMFGRLDPVRYGTYRYPTFCCRNTPFPTDTLLDFQSPVHDLLPGLRDLSADEKPFDYPFVRTFETLMIEPAIYLPAVTQDFERAGGTFVQRDFATRGEVDALVESTIVNCTGLGAATLFGDGDLYPIKGQLTILSPQPEVKYVTLPPDGYMFPRHDGIVLGGTFQHHVATLEPDLVAEEKVMAMHARFFRTLR